MSSDRDSKQAEGSEGPSGEPPDAATLARRYVDLWQEEFAAIAADPTASDQVGRWFASMGQQWADPAAWLTALGTVSAAFSGAQGGVKRDDAERPADAAARAAPAGVASDGGPDDVARLAGRIADLERKLDKLAADDRVKTGGRVGRARRPRRRPDP